MDDALWAEKLSKRFANGVAVEEVSLAVRAGETMALVGESGSGKTTLLRMLGGLLGRDAGEVWVSNERVPNPDEQLLPGHPRVGYLAQHFDLYPNVSVAENVGRPVRARGRAYERRRVSELLALCGLTALADRRPRELSGGERQRTALARALAADPAVLLLDEPFSHLDSPTKRRLQTAVFSILQQVGTAAVVAWHDPPDALAFADRVAVLRAGCLVQAAPPAEVYRQPTDAYVAELFGEMNWLPPDAWAALAPGLPPPVRLGERVGVRPERVGVGPPDIGTPGRVVSAQFRGALGRLEISALGQLLVAYVLAAAPNRWRVGQMVGCTVV